VKDSDPVTSYTSKLQTICQRNKSKYY